LLDGIHQEHELAYSMPPDVIVRGAAAVVGVFFVRDGIYALGGKEMWVGFGGRWTRWQRVSEPTQLRVTGLIFTFMGLVMFGFALMGFQY
jgi:hypothetical protein